MAPAAIDRVRAGYDAFNRRDLDGVLALLSDEIVYRMPLDPMGVHPVFHGIEGVRRFYATLWDGFDEYEATLNSVYHTAPDVIAVNGAITARPRGASATTRFGFSHFWKIAEHRAVAVAFHDAVNPLTLLEGAAGTSAAEEEGSLQ